jgi:hypothetical protein
MMLTLDGPDHAPLCRLVGTIFTPRGAEALPWKVARRSRISSTDSPGGLTSTSSATSHS